MMHGQNHIKTVYDNLFYTVRNEMGFSLMVIHKYCLQHNASAYISLRTRLFHSWPPILKIKYSFSHGSDVY